MSAAVTFGGWIAAGLAGLAALITWRLLELRMESVARASHEMRGPLTAARLGLELGSRMEPLSPQRLRALDLELERAALALDDLTRGGGRCSPVRIPEQIELRELLADSVEAWRASAEAAGAGLRLHWSGADARIRGDRLRLAQATGNLIANAIEHGGQAIDVYGRADRDGVRLEVVDSGPGLPAPVAELVHRAHGGRARRGRGLAIAAAIVERHGGRLAAAPTERGARLVVELPLAEGAPATTPAAG
jgi:signal transduction histidine kinase